MALTFTRVSKISLGNARMTTTDCLIGASGDYSSGITVTAADVGLGTIQSLFVTGSDNAAAGAFYYDQATGKLRALKSAGTAALVEVAGTDIDTYTIRIVAIGDNANKG